MKTIAIVGPESTGKSELAAALANHFNTVWVKEYARSYLEQLNRDYTFNDLKTIAEGQVQLQQDMVQHANGFLFCDTNLLVIKVWSEFMFQQCDAWILNQIKNMHYDYYLLTNIDLPWQPDPLREHPGKRKELFQIYINELNTLKVDFGIVSGNGKTRTQNAIELLKNKFGR